MIWKVIKDLNIFKGSEYDREVLKKSSKKRLSNVTLKDKDFLKIEKKIMIDDNIK